MRILFVLDPLDSIKTYKDTSYAMMREAVARGHHLAAMRQDDLVWQSGQLICFAQDLELTGDEKDWYRAGERRAQSPLDFDCIIMRKDPPFDMEYVYSTYLLEMAEKLGTPVFNRPAAIRDFNEKLSIARFAQFTVPTLVTRHESLIRDFADMFVGKVTNQRFMTLPTNMSMSFSNRSMAWAARRFSGLAPRTPIWVSLSKP